MKLMGTGHRPSKFPCGYDRKDPWYLCLSAFLRQKLYFHRPELVISGMALGLDQALAESAISVGIPFLAAVPFDGFDSRWPDESREHFRSLLDQAAEVVYVSPPGYLPSKMQRRNEYMVDSIGADGVVLALFDGSRGGTYNCLEYARRVGRRIDIIHPRDISPLNLK